MDIPDKRAGVTIRKRQGGTKPVIGKGRARGLLVLTGGLVLVGNLQIIFSWATMPKL